ncbi:MAG: GTP pyrophosphokinase family protein, partial [Eggerthellaceae bacterium]
KPNGYRSLHLIVMIPVFLPEGAVDMKVEIQLRTIAMESWASLEHKLRYKKDMDPELLQSISKELSECAQLSSRLDTRMQTIRYMIDGFDALDEAAIMKQYESEGIDL